MIYVIGPGMFRQSKQIETSIITSALMGINGLDFLGYHIKYTTSIMYIEHDAHCTDILIPGLIYHIFRDGECLGRYRIVSYRDYGSGYGQLVVQIVPEQVDIDRTFKFLCEKYKDEMPLMRTVYYPIIRSGDA